MTYFKALMILPCLFAALIKPLVLFSLVLLAPFAKAEELWSFNAFSLLYGTQYELAMDTSPDDQERFYYTLAHGSLNSWGDLFTFLDISQSTGRNRPNELYGELMPRFSLLRYMAKDKMIKGPLGMKDLLVATAMEYGAAPNGFNQVNYLIGPGFSIDIPHFKIFQLNLYRRMNQRRPDNYQATLVWGVPFEIKKQGFLFDGWLDWDTATPNRPSTIHTQIQLTWDAGKVLFNKPRTLFIGTEYRYWKNKFGIIGVTENLFQALVTIAY